MKNLLIATFPFLSLFAHGQLEYGSVVDTVMCASNKQTYSLYLPSYYSPEKPWPIIYFFEPAARGSLPVRLYSDVDEELGFILVCSNNSRNGSFQLGFEAADAMFADTETKLSIDTERIYTSGFSQVVHDWHCPLQFFMAIRRV